MEALRKELKKVAGQLSANGYVLEAARLQGLADALTLGERQEPNSTLLASEYITGARIGGEFFFRYSLPTMLKMKALTL